MGTSDKDSVLLFSDANPRTYYKDWLYDPDTHTTDHQASGKIVPAIYSLVLEKIGPTKYQLQVVDYVNPDTHKITYADIGWIVTEDSTDITKILSYGNDKWCLYYDDRVKPTKLLVTSTLVILGLENKEYKLIHTDGEGNKTTISEYIDSTDKYISDRIPLTAYVTQKPAIKSLTNCHTHKKLIDGDTVTVQVFNTLGIQTAELRLIVKRATLLNDLDSQTNPITDFDVTSNQEIGDMFYLNQRQDPSHLSITPYITLNDGTREFVPIDNISCFLYGLEDFQASYPGLKQRLLLKYYLSHRQSSTIEEYDGKSRYVFCEKWLTVLPNTSTYGVKISVIPIWVPAYSSYTLKCFLYSERKDMSKDVTDLVTIKNYDGSNFYNEQNVVLTLDLSKIFGNELVMTYRQNVWIKLFPNTDYQRYILKDGADSDVVYGVESSSWHRPVIHYDSALKQYFIPTSVFPNSNEFIELFYNRASPMVLDTDTFVPERPTHFTIRDPNTSQVIIASPIEIEQYAQAWNIVSSQSESLLNNTVIVEFLGYVNNKYNILFGSPCECYKSTSGYRG